MRREHVEVGAKGALAEWRAGWVLPPVAAIGVAVVNTPHYALGVFFAPIERELGWSRAQTASGVLALSLVAILTIPLIGRLVDRKGARRIALPGVFMFGLAFAALGLANHAIWVWWLLWMLLALGASCISPVVWTTAVASRFDRGRGLALAVTLTGAGIGTAVAPLLANWLIPMFGWRTAFMAMAAILATVLLPLVAAFFYSARDLDRTSLVRSAAPIAADLLGMSFADGLRSRQFVQLVFATFLIALALLALVVHFVPIVTGMGVGTARAAEAAALIGIGSIVGRLIAGYLLDRLAGAFVGAIIFALPVLVSLSLMRWGGDAGMIFPIALLLGLSLGSEVDVIAYLTSRHVGLRNFGTLFGVCVSAMALATGLGPWLGGLIYDAFGTYRYMLLGTIPLCLVAATLIALLGRDPAY